MIKKGKRIFICTACDEACQLKDLTPPDDDMNVPTQCPYGAVVVRWVQISGIVKHK